jgi:hypothetical protein
VEKFGLRLVLWRVVEAALLGAIIGLAPLGGYVTVSGATGVMVAGLVALVILSLSSWVLTCTSRGARVGVVQASLGGAALLVLLLVIAVGAPPLEILVRALAGLCLGAVLGLVAGPWWLGWFWVAGGLASFWWPGLVSTGLWPGRAPSLWAAGLAVAGVLGNSLLVNRLRTSRTARFWVYTVLVSVAWLAPFLSILDQPARPWSISGAGWAISVGATIAVCAAGLFFEWRLFGGLWAMTALSLLRTQAGDTLLAARQFHEAEIHYGEALWADPGAPSAGARLAYTLLELGRDDEARELARPLVTHLAWGFPSASPLEQRIALALLRSIDQVASLFGTEFGHPGLLEAAGSEDDELRSQAQRAILEAGDREVMLLREGLVQTSHSLRRFSLEHLLAGAQVALVEGIMGGQLTKTGTAEALAIVQTLLSPSRPFWLRLGRRLARDPGAHGLDVLAEAMVDPRLQAGARRAWDSLRPRLFDRLLDALWEEEMALARQAAGLALQMGEAYIGPLLAAFDAAPRENRRAARCLLRLLLLGEGVPGLETPTALETVEQAGRVQAELLPPRNGYPLSSIPVIQRADGRQMLLLVQGVPYPLRLEGPAMPPGTGKAYVVVNTDDVPVRPSHMQALRGASDARWDLEFTVVPDTETIDRMTLHLLVDKRGRGWPADYDLFVCDASVMDGLDAVEGGA